MLLHRVGGGPDRDLQDAWDGKLVNTTWTEDLRDRCSDVHSVVYRERIHPVDNECIVM
jgi:hypothetical protein